MVDKERMNLGQEVLVGEERLPAVVDGLTQTFAGVIVQGRGYEIVDYEDLYSYV